MNFGDCAIFVSRFEKNELSWLKKKEGESALDLHVSVCVHHLYMGVWMLL